MALRLVLVSVVAGLGLSLPTRTQVSTWSDSARIWATTRLAAWDAQQPAGDDAFVFVTDPVPITPKHDAVVSVAAVKPAATPTVAPTVAVRTKTPTPAPAFQCKKFSSTTEAACQTGLDLTAGLIIPTEPFLFDGPDLAPPATPVAISHPARALVTSNAAFDVAMNAVIAAFAADLPARKVTGSPAIVTTGSKPRAPVIVKNEPRATTLKVAKTETPKVAKTETPKVVKTEIKKATEPVKTQTPKVVKTEIKKATEPVKTQTPKAAKAEVKKATETVMTGPPRPGASPSDARLTQAVQLTREAVFAWANLLHGPVVVTITK